MIDVRFSLVSLVAVAAALLLSSCGTPCKSPDDCDIGQYCAVEATGTGVSGVCTSDCTTREDCEQDPSGLVATTCTNEGKCKKVPRPPKLRVSEPETDTLFPEGTRTIRVLGTVETAGRQIEIGVVPSGRDSCLVGEARTLTVINEADGLATVPFVIDNLGLDPGITTLAIRAEAGGASDLVTNIVEIPCPGCAEISISEPRGAPATPGLVLPKLAGSVSPDTVKAIVWRVRSDDGDVFDGVAPVNNGTFLVEGVPLFAGFNRIEVIVTGVGTGLGESRCSAAVNSAVARERGIRVSLSWDGPTSDLDLHLVGPNGRFGDPMTSLSSRSGMPFFGGTLADDFNGFGPEIAVIGSPPDGVYGVVIEPVFDDRDPGANALIRVLNEGRLLARGAIGPMHVSSLVGEIWIAGTITVINGAAVFTEIDQRLPAVMPPTTPPSMWPTFY